MIWRCKYSIKSECNFSFSSFLIYIVISNSNQNNIKWFSITSIAFVVIFHSGFVSIIFGANTGIRSRNCAHDNWNVVFRVDLKGLKERMDLQIMFRSNVHYSDSHTITNGSEKITIQHNCYIRKFRWFETIKFISIQFVYYLTENVSLLTLKNIQ